LRVLIVDRETDCLCLWQKLVMLDYDCTMANSTVGAFRLTKTHEPFDLVVCGMSMPEVNGLLLCELIKKLRYQVKFVLFCKDPWSLSINDGVLEVDAVFEKPNEWCLLQRYLAECAASLKRG
jgi:CheY-like chemotaxis protein